ncbi:SAM-dependent methyltransferase [Microbacterium sp. 22242]|uniref:SAM-dependent methyltransferase n=1 Tax=Microbacterium sp. 22242 TaxID=3453896 RepID=UPI003F8757E3
MSIISTASPPWLALRASADDAARSRELAAMLVARLAPGPVVLHDLGAGTGGMTRWLAPLLPGPQDWVLHDGDADILEHVDLGAVVDGSGRPIRVAVIVEDLDGLPTDAFAGASAVIASALLDVVTGEEAARIVDACVHAGSPALLSLSVTGGVRLDPPDALDAVIGRSFDDHQRREADGRRMLGPDAVPLLSDLFIQAGWHVQRASTPWRLGPADGALIEEWLRGWVGAAVEQRPELEAEADAYLARRRAQLADGALHVVVPHQDVLAWPR